MQFLQQIEPFDSRGGIAGVVEINQRRVEGIRRNGCQCAGRGTRGDDLDALLGQSHSQCGKHIPLIIDNEQAWSHSVCETSPLRNPRNLAEIVLHLDTLQRQIVTSGGQSALGEHVAHALLRHFHQNRRPGFEALLR